MLSSIYLGCWWVGTEHVCCRSRLTRPDDPSCLCQFSETYRSVFLLAPVSLPSAFEFINSGNYLQDGLGNLLAQLVPIPSLHTRKDTRLYPILLRSAQNKGGYCPGGG